MLATLVFVLRQSSAAWSDPIKIAGQSGVDYFDYTCVRFNSQKQVYVVYKEGTQIHLSKYDGKSVSFVKNVSESRLLCYAPFMRIDSSDVIHIIWAECSTYNSETQYIKYRSFNGSWSPVITIITLNIPGSLPGGYTTRKIDTMRMGLDSRGNMFIVYQSNPTTRSWLVSRYGTETILEPWVVTERQKFPDVAVDDSFIHVVWAAKLSGEGYTIKYAKKVNARHGNWSTPIDVKNGQNLDCSSHLPRITLDGNHTPHVIYMDDSSPNGGGRNTYYRYLAGSRFSERFLVTDNASAYYSNMGISISNSTNNMIITNHVASGEWYNWKVNGQWSGNTSIRPMAENPDNEALDLSRDGQLAALSCTSEREAVYLMISNGDTPGPPPPPVVNIAPKARFTLSPLSGLYPLNVSFDASASSDSDGQIVSYKWNFGDGDKGSGVQVQHLYQQKNFYQITLTVTDDDGATGTAAAEVEVLGIYPPLNVQYQRHVNRNLFSIEYLYRITWDANPRNEEVGAKIVAYKIYRRPAGQGGYGFLVNVPVSNQAYEYLDRTLGSVDRQYDYAITALDSNGRESDMNIEAGTAGVGAELREPAGLDRELK